MDEYTQLGGLITYRDQRNWGHEITHVFGLYWVSFMNKYIYQFRLLTVSKFGVEWVYYEIDLYPTNNKQYRIQLAM